MKGQTAIMEYMIFVLMAMAIIFFVVVLIFGYQIMQSSGAKYRATEENTMFAIQKIMTTPLISTPEYQKSAVLEDAKLTVLTCDDVQHLFGDGLWIQIKAVYEKPDCTGINNLPQRMQCINKRHAIEQIESRECTESGQDYYPDCGTWTYCSSNRGERMVYRSLPVNIYRKMNDTVMIGSLTVGVSGGGS